MTTKRFTIEPELIENEDVKIHELENGNLSIKSPTSEREIIITADGALQTDSSVENAVYPTVEDIPVELEVEGAQVYTEDEGLVVFEAE